PHVGPRACGLLNGGRMRARGFLLGLSSMWIGALLIGCGSSTADNLGEPRPDGGGQGSGDSASEGPEFGRPSGGADCAGLCCPLPHAGDACLLSDEGQSCSGGEVCPGGLSIDRAIVCQSGTWITAGEPCPDPDGGVTASGCPATQPTPGDPCTPP